MEHVSNMTVFINAWIQLVNIIVFFFVFKIFFAWPVIDAVNKRSKMIDQLKNADEILQKKLKEAEKKKNDLIEEWLSHKNKILQQANQEAEMIKQSILQQAEYEKKVIIEKAEQQIEAEKKELEKNWEESVKRAVYVIYEKLVWESDEFIKKYVDNIKDFR
jgi:F0F1-type ATP synthase membrane subunit b/b'